MPRDRGAVEAPLRVRRQRPARRRPRISPAIGCRSSPSTGICGCWFRPKATTACCRSPRGAQDCRHVGPCQGEGRDRSVQGVWSARPDAGAGSSQHPLDRRQHAAARYRLRHADSHVQVRLRSAAFRAGPVAARLLSGVVGIPWRARPRRRLPKGTGQLRVRTTQMSGGVPPEEWRPL